jgi:Domain of unknown function (DUF4398)
MNRLTTAIAAGLLLLASGTAMAAKDDLDVRRLNSSLDQLSSDPTLGAYAQGEQARARDAINHLAGVSSKERAHYLYIAERRVDLAKAVAQTQDAQNKLALLDREHDQILLEASRLDADNTRRQLEQQRLQNQIIAEEAARLQQQGMEYSQAVDQAKAEADKARKLAEAQGRVANAARKEAALAEAAARAMRGDSAPAPKPAPSKGKSTPKTDSGN